MKKEWTVYSLIIMTPRPSLQPYTVLAGRGGVIMSVSIPLA